MVDSETSNLPEKKRTSRRDGQSSSSNTQHDTEAKTRKKSKNASTADVVDIDVNEEQEQSPQTSPKKEKKMSKKRKREVGAGASEANEEEKDVDKKSKKRSKRAREAEPDVAITPVVSTKKRKNKTGFLDPNEDASLSDQTQKCLAYAFLQFHRPSKWKFNKARQNWLIRNIWSKEMIPETHLPLVLGYLGKVQGGVRENLLQSCRAALEPPKTEVIATEPVVVAPVEPSPAEPLVLSESENVKNSRAQALIDLLSPREASPS